MRKGKMTRKDKDELMEIMEKQMKKEEGVKVVTPVVIPKGTPLIEKIHLYIFNFIKSLNGQPKKQVSLLQQHKETIDGLAEIGASILGYGIVGGFSVSLLLILTPCSPEGCIVLTEWLKNNFLAQVLVMVMGSGSICYLFFDLTTYTHKLLTGKGDR